MTSPLMKPTDRVETDRVETDGVETDGVKSWFTEPSTMRKTSDVYSLFLEAQKDAMLQSDILMRISQHT
jgi:hypothetical protein